MNYDEKIKQIRAIVIENLMFYDAPINEVKIKMFAKELENEDLRAISDSFQYFRNERNRRQMPMPSDVKSRIRPEVDPDSLAQEAAGRVIQAVRKFGWPSPDKAREWIGELGWRAVERFGGWQYVCENLGLSLNQTTVFAQVRDISKATLKLGDAGILDKPIGIPNSSRPALGSPEPDGLTSSAEILKFLPKGKPSEPSV